MIAMLVVGAVNSSHSSNADTLLIDAALDEVSQNLQSAPAKAAQNLIRLKKFEAKFSEKQKGKYFLFAASSLAFQGKYQEQVLLVKSILNQEKNPELRASFLYHLSDGYTNLGDYEHALLAMNESVLLLPSLVDLTAKVQVLQSAVLLLNSINAFDEAVLYADRIYALDGNAEFSVAKCIGMADLVEINFLRGNSELARSLISQATRECNGNGRKIISLIVKALAAIDLIDSGYDAQGTRDGLALLHEFSKLNESSDYVTRLEESIARSYYESGNLAYAERYCLQAYERAKSEKSTALIEKTSETMAKIKRAQGNMASALDYYDINLALKKKVLDDQLHKNLAYQRVKFDTQDKANQLNLLEQKNKILSTEKQLEQKNNQNLLMLIALGAILMVVLLAWTLKIIRQKNLFRLSSQLDALTQLSNRGHFVACGMQQFEKTQGDISVILFDMDHFKNINDGFGHASGDWVLKAVSARVTALLPKAGMLGRLGGEEFAICLPKFDTHQALALAESCRAAIAAIDSLPSGFAFPITASFGVASRGMRELKEFEDTLAAADKALYFSKTEGRNRVSLYQ